MKSGMNFGYLAVPRVAVAFSDVNAVFSPVFRHCGIAFSDLNIYS